MLLPPAWCSIESQATTYPTWQHVKTCNFREIVSLSDEEMKAIHSRYRILIAQSDYSDCVDVLDQLEDWTHEIYFASGICKRPRPLENEATLPQLEEQPTRPDQPRSHMPPAASSDDPLEGVGIPCFGD
jgi:hypothetical protein